LGIGFSGLGVRGPEERKADYLRLADAYVMASHWEGFGIVLIFVEVPNGSLIYSILGLLVFAVAVILGEPASFALALLSWLSAAAFILLVQESPL